MPTKRKITAIWEYVPTPDAEERIALAFDLIFSKIDEEQAGAGTAHNGNQSGESIERQPKLF